MDATNGKSGGFVERSEEFFDEIWLDFVVGVDKTDVIASSLL